MMMAKWAHLPATLQSRPGRHCGYQHLHLTHEESQDSAGPLAVPSAVPCAGHCAQSSMPSQGAALSAHGAGPAICLLPGRLCQVC